MVEAELQRLGSREKPRLEGQSLILGKGATEARADLNGSIQQWDSLPDDLRERRARQIAQLLTDGARRAPADLRANAQRRSQGAGLLSTLRQAFSLLLRLALLLAALAVAYRYLSPNRESPRAAIERLLKGTPLASAVASASLPTYNASNIEHERAAIASAACAKSRTRVARGASIGPSDVEGWQVELVLLRSGPSLDLSESAALSPFLQRNPGSKVAKLIWPKAGALLAQERFDAQVELRKLPPLGEKSLSGVSFTFSGPYVVPYFTEDQRAEYFRLADSVSDALGATDGALFAHCADSETHHVGSWFLGATPGGSIASLIYFMESFTDVSVLKPEVVGSGSDAERRGHAFDAISRAASSLSRSSVATLVGSELGMISGAPNRPARLTFPFRDANRASRSGLEAAHSLGLARPR